MFGAVELVPGVNTERTPTALKASLATSQNIRFRDRLTQKIGGFAQFYGFNIAGVPRDLHAWQDLNGATHLLVGTTSNLNVISSGSLVDITPQQFTTQPLPSFIATANLTTITVSDPGVGTLSTFDSVMLNTPVSIGGIILSGLYPVVSILGAGSYEINAATAAISSASGTGTLPIFVSAVNSPLINCTFTAHGLTSGNHQIAFQATTVVSGITIIGPYPVNVVDANHFTFNGNASATAVVTTTMNNGFVSNIYFLVAGPPAQGSGYGTGGYGAGGYGTGVIPTLQAGQSITSSDWTSDNWGEIILQVSKGGPLYQYDPTAGFATASIVNTAPPFSSGMFISSALQIAFLYGSTANAAIGQFIDSMLIRWSDQGDFTQFTTLTTNQAGSYRIPSGSVIRGGRSVQNQNLFWTDLDVWAANYLGFPLVFGFNKIGAGAGMISSHAAQEFRGAVYWMGASNFYSYTGGGVQVIPCPMWDYVFQNINTNFTQNVRAMPNTPYNEIGWLFPSAASVSGECDSWIKMNVTEPGTPWDGGLIARSAWIDQSVLGNPIAASPQGVVYQHEMTNDAAGQPITASFTTGYFYISEGEEYAFVDQIYPDMIWGDYGSQATGTAQVFISFNVTNYPGDAPTTYGPFLMTSTTEYISVRFRGRQMSITITSSDQGSFWRCGRIRYRYSASGRR